jgi:hypothetical protein
VAAKWNDALFSSMNDVSVPVATIPYGNLVQEENRREQKERFKEAQGCTLEAGDAKGAVLVLLPEGAVRSHVPCIEARHVRYIQACIGAIRCGLPCKCYCWFSKMAPVILLVRCLFLTC